MIRQIRFVKREVDNGDGTSSTRTILQQLVPVWGPDADKYGNVYGTCIIGEEWQDVPLEENP